MTSVFAEVFASLEALDTSHDGKISYCFSIDWVDAMPQKSMIDTDTGTRYPQVNSDSHGQSPSFLANTIKIMDVSWLC